MSYELVKNISFKKHTITGATQLKNYIEKISNYKNLIIEKLNKE